jgi:hypothetical protein
MADPQGLKIQHIFVSFCGPDGEITLESGGADGAAVAFQTLYFSKVLAIAGERKSPYP